MADALLSLISGDHPVDEPSWREFWDRLRDRKLRKGEAAALAASLSVRLPDDDTVAALVASLSRPATHAGIATGTVNIVGTGGGRRTFNISTAAGLVAACLGVRVIKTGSRGYTSSQGSIDLLERLGIGLADSPDQLSELLVRFGIACASHRVYPAELTLLASSMLPFRMRQLGRFFNSVGPFLADVPVSAQLTGVSDPALLRPLGRLAAADPGKRIWLCTNSLGIDELVSFADNKIHGNDGTQLGLTPDLLGLPFSSAADLDPVGDAALVDHFLALLSGDGPPSAVHTICLNAAALVVISGLTSDWVEALGQARQALRSGEPARLVRRLADHTPARRSASAVAGE